MTSLTELLARVEGATGADRELDADIMIALDPERLNWAEYQASLPCGAPSDTIAKERRWRAFQYTASIDAALALCERVLPGCTWELSLGRDEDGLYYIANIQSDDYQSYGNGCLRSTSSLTTVAALLKALISQEQSHG
jgi:hypothetical protein